MSESIHIQPGISREEIYKTLLPQIRALIEGEPDLIANLANVCSSLHIIFGFLWTGFYMRRGGDLVLGPFQGPVACTRIPIGKGVCGTAASGRKTINVPDVHLFPGHIACSPETKSEIVVPLVSNEKTVLILDIDSEQPAYFTKTDEKYLADVVDLIRVQHFPEA